MTGIGAVTLAVSDLDRVARFYRSVIGLTETGAADRVVRLGAGGVTLLELRQRAGLLPRDPAAAGLYHIAFLLPARRDLGRWLIHAGRLGQTLDGAADHLVSEAVYLHDPEGNGIEIYTDRPSNSWRWEATADGERVQMENDRLDLIGLHALAADAAAWTGAPAATRIGHVHLQVGDIGRAVDFLTSALGLAVTRAGPQAAFLSSAGYHHHVAVNTWHSAGSGPREPGRAGLEAVTLLYPGRDETLHDPWGTTFRLMPA